MFITSNLNYNLKMTFVSLISIIMADSVFIRTGLTAPSCGQKNLEQNNKGSVQTYWDKIALKICSKINVLEKGIN